MTIAADHYISGLLDERAAVQNLINTALTALSADLSDHDRLTVYGALAGLRSQLGQLDGQLAAIKVNHRTRTILSTI